MTGQLKNSNNTHILVYGLVLRLKHMMILNPRHIMFREE